MALLSHFRLFLTHALHDICWSVALLECVGPELCVIIIAERALSLGDINYLTHLRPKCADRLPIIFGFRDAVAAQLVTALRATCSTQVLCLRISDPVAQRFVFGFSHPDEVVAFAQR